MVEIGAIETFAVPGRHGLLFNVDAVTSTTDTPQVFTTVQSYSTTMTNCSKVLKINVSYRISILG
jgi:hypothetical protein